MFLFKNIIAVMGNELESMESLIKKELSDGCQFDAKSTNANVDGSSSGLVGVGA